MADLPAAESVEFIESVRDEVHYAAEAKRHQLQRGYSNATIESMLSGIQWREAAERASSLIDVLGAPARTALKVVSRELTAGTVNQVDDLLQPAVRELRTAWETLRGNNQLPTLNQNVDESMNETVGSRFVDIPPDLYQAFALCAVAVSTAWNLKRYIDEGGGSVKFAVEYAEELMKQVPAALDAFRAVKRELLAVAESNCAHKVAVEFTQCVLAFCRHEGAKDIGTAKAGNINCEDLADNWARFRERIGRIGGFDLKALGDRMEIEAAKAAAERSRKRANDPILGACSRADGPIPPSGFRYAGEEYSGCRQTAWRLIHHLWSSPNRSAVKDDLAEPVWGDSELLVTDGQLGSARRDANRFFKRNSIPWRIEISKGDAKIPQATLVIDVRTGPPLS